MNLFAWPLYLAHAVLLPPLLLGFIRLGKARLQNRRGSSALQPFWDMAKMLRKGETVSETATWVFRAAPLVSLACVLATALLVPWLSVPSPMPGDLFLVIYLMALGRFAMSLSALDTGSAFGALGASRESAISIQVEPALMLALTALAVRAHSSSLERMLGSGPVDETKLLLAPVVVAALWLAATAELSRMPVDDPTTHLELTMVHEALILENSGRNLAFVEYASALKVVVLLGLVAQVARPLLPATTPVGDYLLSLGLILVGGMVLVVAESTLVKLRWRRIPNLLSFAVIAGALACLLVALKG